MNTYTLAMPYAILDTLTGERGPFPDVRVFLWGRVRARYVVYRYGVVQG